jgi:nucleotide-binding universal stress UspA family protein
MSTVAKDIPFYEMPTQRRTARRRNRILCVSDLGSQSEHALHRAAHLARSTGSDLLVLHVLSEKHSEQVLLSTEDRDRLRLTIPTERAIPDAEQPTTVQIRRGKPFQVIKHTANEWKAELLVVAAPARNAFERIRGTVEEQLFAAVDCPVLFVRNGSPHSYSKVAVATDLLPPSMQAARKASELGFFDDVDVTFMHAFHLPYDGINLGDPRAAEQLESYRQKTGGLVEQQLKADIAATGLKKYRTSVHSQLATEPELGVAAMANELGSELLVMSTPRRFALKRLFNRSTAHRILRRAQCDVLAVPRSKYG